MAEPQDDPQGGASPDAAEKDAVQKAAARASALEAAQEEAAQAAAMEAALEVAEEETKGETKEPAQEPPPEAPREAAAQEGAAVGVTTLTPAEIEAMRAENAALKAQLAEQSQAKSTGGGWRSVVAWILAALAVLGVVLAVFAVWLNTTIKDEDRFVATFGTLPEQEEVVTVLSQRVADELIVAAEVEAVLAESLPTEIAFLSVPVTEGVRQLTTRVAADIIATEVFAGIWRAALRASHQAVDAVLATEGRIAVDLDEAAASISDALAERGVTVFEGQDVDLPEIVLFENDQIAAVSELINFVDTLGWLLPLIGLLFVVAAIWVSPDRRKTTAFLGFATGIVLILDLAILRIIRANTVGAVEDEVSRAAAETVWDTTLRFYTQGVWAVIVLAFAVGFVAWVFGPSARAVRVRGAWNNMLARWSGPQTDEPRSGFSKFVFTYRRPIQWGAVILGLLFILFGPAPSVASVIITALIVLAVVGFAQAVSGPGSPDTAADETKSSGEVVIEEEVVVATGTEAAE
jgi:hypothetical protein